MENGLLFNISGEKGPLPDYANGNAEPNFLRNVESIEDGVKGKAIRCHPNQLLAYWAPGNVYSQRGSIAFFWRSRTPLGETEFPIFRVSFADHSSWDAVFIRIDYNGHGIDAFVTDINLSRVRVTHNFGLLPQPDQWFHACFTWDETIGVSLYIDGVLVAEKRKQCILYAGLDQFGTHSRIISSAQVQSSYNYMRTGDFDEVKVYDRMLSAEDVLRVSLSEPTKLGNLPERTLLDTRWANEWSQRYGFEGSQVPAPISYTSTIVKKVEVHNAWDLKRWWWKGCDGIRETTWPGVYNRSRLPGRTDYFVLPDWDCYSQSGKVITFEPISDTYFNHVEISGSATGSLRIHGRMEEQLTLRRESSERSVLRLAEPVKNVSITFTNDKIEEPIGDLTLLHIYPGCAPDGVRRDFFALGSDHGRSDVGVDEVRQFINGRYLPDERTTLIGGSDSAASISGLPIVHVILPYTPDDGVGLDGVLLHFPSLQVQPSHGDYVLVNIQIKDPLWLYRNLMNFTFSLLPGNEKDIWLDVRDRILPENKALYMTLAFSSTPRSLDGFAAELIYKARGDALKEHIEDRWIQVKDNYSNLVEENPSSEHFNMFNRFKRDIVDLLRACPEHRLARLYWYDKFKTNPPGIELPLPPTGVPLWAWRQSQYMEYVKRYIGWWIDKRQISNGEFGGGLSDDGDLTAWWPGPAMAGCMPKKITESLLLEMEAFYDQGMFANGLCAIQTDQLHVFEEGMQVLGQCLILDPTSPRHIERAMETVRGLFHITGINAAGHRHVRSAYFSGTRIASESPWAHSASDSYHVFGPAYLLVRYNGNPLAKALIMELADSMMEHFDGNRLKVNVDFETDESAVHERTREWPLFYAAWRISGDSRYLQAIADKEVYAPQDSRLGNNIEEQLTEQYEALTINAELREYINTEGHLWVDRGILDIAQLQRDRIGGIAHERFALYPRHYFRWNFEQSLETSIAVVVLFAGTRRVRFTAFNMLDVEVGAVFTPEDMQQGEWRMLTATSAAFNSLEGASTAARKVTRFTGIRMVFASMQYTTVEMEFVSAGKSPWQLPDLAIGEADIAVRNDCVRVLIHNVGAVRSKASTIVLRSSEGEVLRTSNIPELDAPNDLYPKTLELPFWTRGIDLDGCSIEIDPECLLEEISRENNRILLRGDRNGSIIAVRA